LSGERTLKGDKKPGKGGSKKPNGSGKEFGIASKMQARSVDPAAEADGKISRRRRRVKGRIEERASTGTEKRTRTGALIRSGIKAAAGS